MIDPFLVMKGMDKTSFQYPNMLISFVAPIYDLVYSRTCWLKTSAPAFFHQIEKPIYIELYATNLSTIMNSIHM
jgi:hypothetical protein